MNILQLLTWTIIVRIWIVSFLWWSTSNKLMDSIPNILWQMLDMAHTTIIFSVNRTELMSKVSWDVLTIKHSIFYTQQVQKGDSRFSGARGGGAATLSERSERRPRIADFISGSLVLFLGTLGKILRAVNHNRPEALFTFVLAFPAQFVVSDTAAII